MVESGSWEDGFADMSNVVDPRLLMLNWIDEGIILDEKFIRANEEEIQKTITKLLQDIDTKVAGLKTEILRLDDMRGWIEDVRVRLYGKDQDQG